MRKYGGLMTLALIAAAGAGLYYWLSSSGLLTVATTAKASPAMVEPTPEILSKDTLMDPKLDPLGRATISEKLALKQNAEALQAAGKAKPAPKDPSYQPESMQGVGGAYEVQTGIFPGSEGMVRPDTATINNHWVGLVNGTPVVVLAGSEPDAAGKGVLVIIAGEGAVLSGFQKLQAPENAGSLTIQAEQDGLLVLSDASGQTFIFNPQTMQFE